MVVEPKILPPQEKKAITPIQSQPLVAKSLMPPGKFEVGPEQTFSIKLFIVQHKGLWKLVEKEVFGCEVHTVVFRMWTFDECLRLRRDSTIFDPTTRTNRMDNDKLNKLKIMKLLQEWTLGKDNPRLEIHRVGDVLTDGSWQSFMKLSPNIAERIISEMNSVLEYGG